MSGGWAFQPLGEVFDVIGGGTPSKTVAANYDGDIPWATIRDMQTDEISDTERSITEHGLKNSSAKLIPAGEVVMASRVGLGKAGILRRDTAINQDIRALIPKRSDQINRRFCLYWLQSTSEQIVAAGSGATVQGIKLPFIRSLSFPAIARDEQDRIVAILDQAFAALDRARAHAEANLADAAELFESFLSGAFSTGGPSWIPCTVGDVVTLQRGFDITKAKQIDGDVPVISSGGAKSFHSVAKASGPGVVIGRKGSIGSVYYIEQDYWPHDTTLFVKDFKGHLPLLVSYLFRGLGLAKLDTGAANPSLNRNLVHPLKINWPPLEQQEAVAASLSEVERASLEIQSSCRSKLADISALRQSLLQQAFSGQLTRWPSTNSGSKKPSPIS
ncbi:MAG: restriction endonuclease subunit S [Luteimonas sp.]